MTTQKRESSEPIDEVDTKTSHRDSGTQPPKRQRIEYPAVIINFSHSTKGRYDFSAVIAAIRRGEMGFRGKMHAILTLTLKTGKSIGFDWQLAFRNVAVYCSDDDDTVTVTYKDGARYGNGAEMRIKYQAEYCDEMGKFVDDENAITRHEIEFEFDGGTTVVLPHTINEKDPMIYSRKNDKKPTEIESFVLTLQPNNGDEEEEDDDDDDEEKE